MTQKKKRKKLILSVTAVAVVAALGAGIWFGTRGSGEPVNVYPFQYIGMTEFWGDAQESYGPVTTDKIQTAFLSDTQTVTEVKVKDGETVKKGDVLFSFDTTLDALSLERKRLEVEKIKVQIKAAEERLQETRELVPYVPPEPTEPEEEDLGEELKDKLYKISENVVYDGSKPEAALICWLKDTTPISSGILQELYQTSLKYREENAKKQESEKEEQENQESSSASDEPGEENPVNLENQPESPKIKLYPSYNGEETKAFDLKEKTVKTDGEEIHQYILPDTDQYAEKTYWLLSATRNSDDEKLTSLVIPGYPREDSEEREQWEDLWGEGITAEYTRGAVFEAKTVQDDRLIPFPEEDKITLKTNQQAVLVITSQLENFHRESSVTYSVSPADGIFETSTDGNRLYLVGTPEKTTIGSVDYTVTAEYEIEDNEGDSWRVVEPYTFSVTVESQGQSGEFYVVFKTTEKNFLKGVPTVWHGAKVTAFEDGSFEVTPYDAATFADHTLPPPEEIEIELPDIDPDAIYTAEQILDMQKQCYATIKEQTEKLKMAETEYDIMQRELGDGNIYAEIDGKVVSLLTEEEARQQKQPFVKVSGGGGFYIEGSVSELEKEKLKLGQEVTVNDWNSGGTYTGEVVSIGDFPSDSDNWNGMGNPNASYYPFKAFVGEEADLQAGSYVSMSYSTASAEHGIYLEKAFVRTEKGSSWIFVRGADGKLEKRNVKVGKVLWGSYYEILSPLGEEDFLAFPYGKNVRPGAPTVESDLSALYSY